MYLWPVEEPFTVDIVNDLAEVEAWDGSEEEALLVRHEAHGRERDKHLHVLREVPV